MMLWKLSINVWVLVPLSLCLSCSLPTPYEKVFVRSDWKDEVLSPSTAKLGIAFTGNFHNNLLAHKERIPWPDEESSWYLKIGGHKALRSYLDVFKKRYPAHLVLDSGYVFAGRRAESQVKGQILRSYDDIGYDAVAMADRELVDFMERREDYGNLTTPILTTNIVNLKTGHPLKGHSVTPYKIVVKEGIRIGLISFTYPGYFSGRDKKKMAGVYFEDPVASFLRAKQVFKKEKVDLTIAMVRLDGQCSTQIPTATFEGTFKSQHPVVCDQDRLVRIIKRLPPNSIDLIISGDQQFAMGYLEGIPMAQIGGEGKYLGLLELYYDTAAKKLLQAKTRFHPPIKLCHHFFSSTKDCYIQEIKTTMMKKLFPFIHRNNYRPIPARFLGHIIVLDNRVSESSIKENISEYH